MSQSAAQTEPHERRRHTRYALSGRFPGHFCREDGEPLTVIPVDISAFGLGVVFGAEVSEGGQVRFTYQPDSGESLAIALEIRWVYQGVEHERGLSGFRCGLWVIDESVHLEELLEDAPTLSWEDLT